MEKGKKLPLTRGLWYSSFSGTIISMGLGLYTLLSPQPGWEAIGAGLVAAGLLSIGPFVGFFCSFVVAGLVYIPVYIASYRSPKLPIFLLPITGSITGLIAVLIWRENPILPVYFIFAFWGALGGYLFVFGVRHHKIA